MAFGVGMGGFFQGLNEARQRAQQEQMQQQQLAMQQQAQQAEQDYRNRALTQQASAESDAQKAEARKLAFSQIQYYQNIVSDPVHHSPGEIQKAGLYLNHLWDQNPDLDPRPKQQPGAQTPAGQPQMPQTPQAQAPGPATASAPSAPQADQFSPAQLFGNQASQYQMNPSIGGAVPTPPQQNEHPTGPPIPPTLFANPHPTAPQVAQPTAAPNQPQAPVDPLIQGFQHSIATLQQQLDSPPQGGWSPDQIIQFNTQINALQQGIAARTHQMSQEQREGAESKSKIGLEEAQAKYYGAETAAKPEEMKSRAIQARAEALKAVAELERIKSQGQPTPADKVRILELQHKIDQDRLAADHWNKEYKLKTGIEAFNEFKTNYGLTQRDQELGQKEPEAVTQARAAKLKTLMNSAMDPITKTLNPKKVPALMSAIDKLSQQTGSPVGIQELTPPGIHPDVWNAVNQPGFDPHKAIAAAMAVGRKDYAGQIKTAMGLAGRMQGHLQKSAAGMQRPATSLTDPLGLQGTLNSP